MTIEQRVAVLEAIFSKLQDYYMSGYSGEEIDALLASAGVPIGITKEYDSVSAMNSDFSGTDVTRGQFVLILPSDTSSEDYGKVYIKSTSNWVYIFTLTALTAIKGPQGPAGANGETGATGQPGKNFAVLGYYETLSALNASVPSPEAGDTYGIGTEPPYAYYMYDPTISTWRYVGNLQGPAGSQGEKGDKGDKGDTGAIGPQGPEGPVGGASNFVRYDSAQALTDAQKTQARGNINAAPGGFGLGDFQGVALESSVEGGLNTAVKCGWYYFGGDGSIANAPSLPDGGYGALLVSSRASSSTVTQICFFETSPTIAIRRRSDSEWQPWEYLNPPMLLGIEYRTTERYLGKPVYVQAANFGTLPNAATKSVTWATSGVVLAVLSVEATSNQGAPLGLGASLSGTEITATTTTLYVKSSGDYSDNTAVFRVKYTKTTD